MPFDALVLAGGSGRRLGGVDKPGLVVGGVTLLDGVLHAVDAARTVVVVGEPREVTGRAVVFTRERPAGTGPVAAIAAGLKALPSPPLEFVAICAGDLVHFGQSTVDRLLATLEARGDADGVVLRDEDDRAQWLAGVWRTEPLAEALPDDPANVSVRATLGRLSVHRIDALPGEGFDVDSEADLRRAREERGR
jgi:molybdopterin-guanine dinucleotide biosynthesis protein A